MPHHILKDEALAKDRLISQLVSDNFNSSNARVYSWQLQGSLNPNKFRPVGLLLQMEFSDGIRHAVAFNTLNIRHLVDLSPSTVSFAKEVRYCVIAVVIGFATTSIVKSVLNYRRRRD